MTDNHSKQRLWTILCATAGRLFLAAAAIAIAAPQASALTPRTAPAKPSKTVLRAGDDPRRIELKLAEGTAARLSGGTLRSPSVDLSALESTLSRNRIPSHEVQRLFSRPEAELDAERSSGQVRSGRALADLNLYYSVKVPNGVDAAALCDELNALPYVELATPAPVPAPPPVDIAPPTPDYEIEQDYTLDAPGGIGSASVQAGTPGTDGTGIAIVDIEYQWVLDHEDLELPASANIDTATLSDPFPSDEGNHGTAVLGVLGAKDNGYGMTGVVSGATLLVAPANTVQFGYNVARAVNLAAGVLSAGDVILLEQQTCVCGESCSSGQDGLGPVEWHQSIFDAISAATALGIVVVQAAGNGDVDLDQAGCLDRFNRNVRDSGAIIVGAGSSSTHSRLSFSCYGDRVDVQGWGHNVATLGYGGLFDPGDVRQRYTAFFSGTSSASPVVTSAVAAIQGAHVAAAMPVMTPADIRDLLVSTGTPQGGDLSTPIGPLPDLEAALLPFTCGDNILNPAEECDGTADAACPGLCLPPGGPNQCMCPICGDDEVNGAGERCDGTDASACPGLCRGDCSCPPTDDFLCYKAKLAGSAVSTFSDAYDSGTIEARKGRFFCTAADLEGDGLADAATHLSSYKIKGPHDKQSGLGFVNRLDELGLFSFDTKKNDSLLVPTAMSILPDAPPGPPTPGHDVDNFRCLRAKTTPKTLKYTKGAVLTDVADQFGTRDLAIKKVASICAPTDKDGSGIVDSENYLMCLKVKPSSSTSIDGVQLESSIGTETVTLKKEALICIRSAPSP